MGIKNGSFTSSAPKVGSASAARHVTPEPGEQRPRGLGLALDHRPPAVRRRSRRSRTSSPASSRRWACTGRDIDVRGATSAPFPGYMLIGRAENFALTLTSAAGDIIDTYAETLCGGSKLKYEYKGKCLPMQKIYAGTITKGDAKTPVVFYKTVHGSVYGYAKTTKGKTVAHQQASLELRQGHARPALLPGPDLRAHPLVQRLRQVGRADAADLQLVLRRRDHRRRLHRPACCRSAPTAPTATCPPTGAASTSGPATWRPAATRRARSPTGCWSTGTTSRRRSSRPPTTASATRPCSRARRCCSTTSRRTPAAHAGQRHRRHEQGGHPGRPRRPVLAHPQGDARQGQGAERAGRRAPSEQIQAWADQGGAAARPRRRRQPRLRRQRDHGRRLERAGQRRHVPDAGRQAVQPARHATVALRLAPTHHGEQYGGWYHYMAKDFSDELGQKVPQPYSRGYCGGGSASKCSAALWKALDQPRPRSLAAQQGPDPSAWRESASAQTIQFSPLPLHPDGLHQPAERDSAGDQLPVARAGASP